MALFVLVAPVAQAQAPDLSQIPPLRTKPPPRGPARSRSNSSKPILRCRTSGPGLQRGAQFMQQFIKEKIDPDLLVAMQQAITEKPEVLAEMQARAVEVYARSYTDEELEAMVRYRQSPLSRSIMDKRLAKLIYCKDRPNCPPASLRSAPSASAPSTARP